MLISSFLPCFFLALYSQAQLLVILSSNNTFFCFIIVSSCALFFCINLFYSLYSCLHPHFRSLYFILISKNIHFTSTPQNTPHVAFYISLSHLYATAKQVVFVLKKTKTNVSSHLNDSYLSVYIMYFCHHKYN